MFKRALTLTAALSTVLLSACAVLVSEPTTFSNIPLEQVDKDTKAGYRSTPSGFDIEVLYQKYQYAPETAAVGTACKSQLTSLAYEYADQKRRKITPIPEQRIKISFGRNGNNGMTSCRAFAPVRWQ